MKNLKDRVEMDLLNRIENRIENCQNCMMWQLMFVKERINEVTNDAFDIQYFEEIFDNCEFGNFEEVKTYFNENLEYIYRNASDFLDEVEILEAKLAIAKNRKNLEDSLEVWYEHYYTMILLEKMEFAIS